MHGSHPAPARTPVSPGTTTIDAIRRGAGVNDLIDTTEMYLRTILELEEEGVPPLRARIAERLHQSGPTVSQTVARMERDGLLTVENDRHLLLTEEGRVWVNGGKLGLYATYFTGCFYVDAAVTGGYNSFDTKRSAHCVVEFLARFASIGFRRFPDLF